MQATVSKYLEDVRPWTAMIWRIISNIFLPKKPYSKFTQNIIKIFKNQVYYDWYSLLPSTNLYPLCSIHDTHTKDPSNALKQECLALPMNLSSEKQIFKCKTAPSRIRSAIMLQRFFFTNLQTFINLQDI